MKKVLCCGINNYPGSSNDLRGCVNDANDWERKLSELGFNTQLLLNSDVTIKRLKDSFKQLVANAYAGDVIGITYSGHGTQVPDRSGDEPDGYDEALFLHDGMFIDDEFRMILKDLREDVHCFIILDSCFSGTATRAPSSGVARYVPVTEVLPEKPVKKFLEEEDMIEVLCSGCGDDEYSYDAYIDGRWNGAFTRFAIDSILRPELSYAEWHTILREHLPSSHYPQTPQLECNTINRNRQIFSSEFNPDPPANEPDEPWYSKYITELILGAITFIVVLILIGLNC